VVRIGFGCVTLGSASGPSPRAGTRLVRAAIDAGITLFDTADAYGSGASERVLGRALAGRRDEVEIATKVGYVFDERSPVEQWSRRLAAPAVRRLRRSSGTSGVPGPGGGAYAAQDFSPAHLRAALQGSLRRLGTDHVDVYQLHGPRRAHPELLPVLRELVDEGLVRRIGVGAEQLAVAREWVGGGTVPGETTARPDVIQIPFGPLDPQAATMLFPEARTHHVDLWARGVFGGGMMAAAANGSVTLGAGDRSRLDALRTVAEDLDLDLFELAVAFVRSFADVSVVMLGMSSETHLRRNVELVRTTSALPDEVVRRICDLSLDGDPAGPS
jgi:aryl-alcohol dehydrogenase-like predicted oxidoreductase